VSWVSVKNTIMQTKVAIARKKLKILILSITVIMSAISIALLIICIWALIFFSYYSAFLAFIGVLILFPFKLNNKRTWLIRTAVFLIGLILLVTTIHIPIGEINNRISLLANKPRSKSSISSFSTRDKIGIYGLNVMMGILSYPIYPEISKETLMMIFPPPENGVRTFRSDFAINSEKIRNVIKKMNKKLLTEKGSGDVILNKRIFWNVSSYSFGKKEARYALALNPSDISLTASKRDSVWVIDISLKVKCSYPRKSYVTIISKPKLKIEEGLFWVLQQAGWLFPYTADWKFTINSDDERIN